MRTRQTWWSREKQADVLSTGSMTTMTLIELAETLIFFIHTETGNSTPYDVTASIYAHVVRSKKELALVLQKTI